MDSVPQRAQRAKAKDSMDSHQEEKAEDSKVQTCQAAKGKDTRNLSMAAATTVAPMATAKATVHNLEKDSKDGATDAD